MCLFIIIIITSRITTFSSLFLFPFPCNIIIIVLLFCSTKKNQKKKSSQKKRKKNPKHIKRESSTVNIFIKTISRSAQQQRLPKTSSSSSCRLPRTTSKRKHPRASTRASAAWSWKAGRSSSTTKTETSDGRSRARRKDVRFLFIVCVRDDDE